MGPIWNLWRMILDPNGRFLRKKIFDRSLRKKLRFWNRHPLDFFLFLAVIYFWEFHRNLHRISSTDFKFHVKICIRSRAMTFWIFVPFFGTYFKNWQRYNFWTDAYFYMKGRGALRPQIGPLSEMGLSRSKVWMTMLEDDFHRNPGDFILFWVLTVHSKIVTFHAWYGWCSYRFLTSLLLNRCIFSTDL
jgi:hypothetical protein